MLPSALESRTANSEERANMECFLLTLAYDLLRSHPSVMTRHLNDASPLTMTYAAHETVVTQPLQLERRSRDDSIAMGAEAMAIPFHRNSPPRMKWIMAGLLLFVVSGVGSWIARSNKEGSAATLVAQH